MSDDLARRAVACKRWRWMPGCRDTQGCRLTDNGVWWQPDDWDPEQFWRLDCSHVPDFSDPATRGCLLALVREAWWIPDLFAYVYGSRHGDVIWTVGRVTPHGDIADVLEDHPVWVSEAAALVAALEAAP